MESDVTCECLSDKSKLQGKENNQVQRHSVQFSRSVLSDSLWPHGLQHTSTNSWSLLKLVSTESVMPSNHLILCRPLLPPSIPPSIRVFSNQSALHIRWPKYWVSASASTLPMNIQDWFPLGWTGWISLQSKGHYIMIKMSIHQKDTEILSGMCQITELQSIWSKNLKETQTIPQLLLEISTALSQPTELDEN